MSRSPLALLLVLLFPSLAAADGKPNPYIEPASRLYRTLEFQEALRTVEKAIAWPSNTPEEEVRAALVEGVITAQLGKTDRAIGAFKRGLALDSEAQLPFKVPPKIQKIFEKARQEIRASSSPRPPVVNNLPPPLLPPPVEPLTPALSQKTGEGAQGVAKAPEVAVTLPPAEPVPPASTSGLIASAAFVSDVTARSVGAELGGGYHFGDLDASLRLRPGKLIGIGLLAAYGGEIGPARLFAGLRGDVYAGASTLFGAGLVGGARFGLFSGFGLLASASLEKFVGGPPSLRPFGVVLSLGADFRQ